MNDSEKEIITRWWKELYVSINTLKWNDFDIQDYHKIVERIVECNQHDAAKWIEREINTYTSNELLIPINTSIANELGNKNITRPRNELSYLIITMRLNELWQLIKTRGQNEL